MVEFTYNNKIHAVTKTLPFKANYGQDLRMGFEGRRKGKYEAVGKFVEKMKKIQEEAKAALEKAQEEMKKFRLEVVRGSVSKIVYEPVIETSHISTVLSRGTNM